MALPGKIPHAFLGFLVWNDHHLPKNHSKNLSHALSIPWCLVSRGENAGTSWNICCHRHLGQQLWGPKREMCLFVLWTSYPMITTHSEGITGSTLPVRASKMLHFFHVDFARPNLDRCSKALGEKCSKRVYLEDPGGTAPQIVFGELFFWLYCNPVLNGINPLGGLPGCLTSY